jgi:peptide chain release factor 1
MTEFELSRPKLEKLAERLEELNEQLSDMAVINNQKLFRELSRELSYVQPLVQAFNEHNEKSAQLADAEELVKDESDPDMVAMATEEIDSLAGEISILEATIRRLLIPPDPMADRNIIMEIRAGTGGDEAALFVGDLFRMYSRFAEKKRWKVEILDSSETQLGGYREIVFSISGKEVYADMRFEYGGHRVQRVPATESGGRVHTSAVTVAVMPEVEATEIEVKNEDLRIDVMRAGGAGGQHVNKTESAVRITHLPTNIVVQCQDSPSQHMNKASALKVLRARLYEREQEIKAQERAEMRKTQVGSGDRSQKVRTYNYPQNRVTDHRINMTLYKLDLFMQGDIEEMIEALIVSSVEEQLTSE